MYHPMPTAPTLVSAWVNAAQKLNEVGDLHGLMLHIEDPVSFLPGETDVISRVDEFLKSEGKCGISTVSNTIFPAALDRNDGIDGLTARYLEVFERRMHRQGEWGRYFERMVAWKKGKSTVNQLGHVISSLRDMKSGDAKFFENVTEIALFDPRRDLRKKMNRQCLSFIELKPHRNGSLHMMAVYRNHYYVQRTLGNLIGLGRLLAFLSKETGFDVGTLTIQSTHACLDQNFSRSAVRELIKACADDHREKAA